MRIVNRGLVRTSRLRTHLADLALQDIFHAVSWVSVMIHIGIFHWNVMLLSRCRRLVRICILSIYIFLCAVSWLPCLQFACCVSPSGSAVASPSLCYKCSTMCELSWTGLDMHPLHPRLFVCRLLATVSGSPSCFPFGFSCRVAITMLI